MAVVVPERKAVEDWAAENNETGDFNTLCNNAKARKYFLEELNSTGQKHKVCHPTSFFLFFSSWFSANKQSSPLSVEHRFLHDVIWISFEALRC